LDDAKRLDTLMKRKLETRKPNSYQTASNFDFPSNFHPYPAMIRSLKLLLTLLLLLISQAATARTISWGSAVGDSLFYSDGSDLDTDTVFELGFFSGGFTPDENNMDYWLAHWHVFDRATDGAGWDTTDPFLSRTPTLQTDGTSTSSPPLPAYVFPEGGQAYIWAYRTDQTYQVGLEWALITNNSSDGNSDDDWRFPAHSDQTGLPLEWRLSTASTPVFGRLNDEDGAGERTSTVSSTELQTHTLSVIPEPGSALLFAIASSLLLQRRRRR
jgi:hypothetical protein